MKRIIGVAIILIFKVLGIYLYLKHKNVKSEEYEALIVSRLEWNQFVTKEKHPDKALLELIMIIDNPIYSISNYEEQPAL